MNPTTVHVALDARSYDILIGPGLLARAGEQVAALKGVRRLIVITDTHVAPRYLERVMNSLSAAGLQAESLPPLPAGEGTKSFAQLEALLEAILEKQPERGTALVALGGGVIGDLVGFAASIVLRGVPFIQMPTTLLSQVDSSVGGKTAINSRHGKNLIGSFHQPLLVLADTDCLAPLPRRELLAGYAEVVKYGLIDQPEFFAWLEAHGPALIEGDAEARRHAVEISCRAKARIVEADEKESGKRALLNLGHTFGHALEKATGYSDLLNHGEAVALGCVMALQMSVARGLATREELHRLRHHFTETGLLTHLSQIPHRFSAEALASYCKQDKKVKDGKLTFILLRGIGHAFITQDVTEAEAAATFAEFGA
jgi:3-dehydroquinate synthase